MAVDEKAPLVTGEIVIPAGAPVLAGATAHVYLEEVSRADGAARVLLETEVAGLRHPSAGAETRVPFALFGEAGGLEIDPRADYAVRVWVDAHSGGKGDLYSKDRHAVLTQGNGSAVSVGVAP